jgi:hypothetical protein
MSKDTPLAKVVFQNLTRHLGPKPKTEAETDAAYAKRVDAALKSICGKNAQQVTKAMGWESQALAPTLLRLIKGAVCIRWNCSPNTFEAFMNGRRPPTHKKNRAFFADLRTYGAATTNADGVIDAASLGSGPDLAEFLDRFQGYSSPA